MTSADEWRAALRPRLVAAMKVRDKMGMAALRSLLGAIDNAEAADTESAPAVEAGVIAGGVVGLGAGEVARRQLSPADLVALCHHEVTDRRTAAEEYRGIRQLDAAAVLDAEADVIEAVLRDRIRTSRSFPGPTRT
jgi:uncharacterized protein